MTLVVDASVAIKWFIFEPHRGEALGLLEPEYRLVAPELVVAEVANAMWKRVGAGQGYPQQGSATVAPLPRFFDRLFSLVPLASPAVEIATALRHPVYDCFYLALAESEDATLVTADRRLIGRLAGSRWQSRCRPPVP